MGRARGRRKTEMPQEILNPQRERERSHLGHFANRYGFPTEALKFGDKPDLIVHTDTGDVGIEHTKLVRVEAAPGIVLPQAQEQLQDRVVSRAQAIFEERGGGMLGVNAHFSSDPNNILGKRNVDEAAFRLAAVIAHAAQILGPEVEKSGWQTLEGWNYEERFPGLFFPAQIDLIHFQVVDHPGFVLWGVPRGCFVPDITTQHLQQTIDGKEAKLGSYRSRCSEVWLSMVTENWLPSSYFNITPEVAEFTFRSAFDRVFYFEHFDGKIVELKVNHAL